VSAPTTFRGPPHRLSSLVELPAGTEALAPGEARLEGADVRSVSVRPLTREGIDMGKLTLRLPESTPPGTYEGTVELGSQAVPIVVEVEPRRRLEASPARFTFETSPGGEVTANASIVNVGNVPWDLPAASTFCIFDGSGIDHAVWVALANDPPEGKERIDVLMDDLAESHGGLVEVRARTKEKTVAPGESRDVQLTLKFSDRLRPGHTYSGSWAADGLRLSVRVTVPEQKGTRE
jgi:hypothetical protein